MTGPTLDEERTAGGAADKAILRRQKRAAAHAEAASAGWKVWLVKIASLAIIDALAVYGIFVLIAQENWLIALIFALVVVAVNLVYLTPGLLPAKYLTPGILFLLIFQVFLIVYTIYVSLTNYGSGHNSSKDDAVNALLLQSQTRVEESSAYPVKVLEQSGEFFFLATDPDGQALLGGAEQPLAEVDAQTDGGQAVAVEGYSTLDFGSILANQDAVAALAVPLSDDPNDGFLRTTDGSTAYVFVSTLEWDPAADTMTDTTGVVYSDVGTGAFTAEDGTELLPGWQVNVGIDNYVAAFTEQSIRGPFLYVLVWTFAFAILSVATTFALGLFLA
ncbi:MAG TPA: maltose ABC transporter permease, partial [Microbacterium sp.]|nr:maltose ABC transporter permease [Microbacterium sp.]